MSTGSGHAARELARWSLLLLLPALPSGAACSTSPRGALLGELAPGKRAALLVLAQNPLDDPQPLAAPVAVYIDGQAQP